MSILLLFLSMVLQTSTLISMDTWDGVKPVINIDPHNGNFSASLTRSDAKPFLTGHIETLQRPAIGSYGLYEFRITLENGPTPKIYEFNYSNGVASLRQNGIVICEKKP